MSINRILRDLQNQIDSVRELLGLPSKDLRELERKVTDLQTRVGALERNVLGEVPDAWLEKLDAAVKRLEKLTKD